MTDTGKDDSMDGAVAAIRRILQTGDAEEPGPAGRDEETDVFPLTREMMAAAAAGASDDGDGPLVLTPEMLADEKPRAHADGTGSESGSGTPPPAATAGRPAAEEPPAPTLDEATFDGATLDEARVERIVRRVLREELADAAGEPLPADVRRMIRVEVEQLLSGRSTGLPPG